MSGKKKKNGDNGLVFEDWFEGQGDDVQKMIDGHISGLKSALDSERGTRKDLQKELKELAGKAEDGSEMRTKLDKLTEKLDADGRKLKFYESAHKAGVRNLKLAFLAAEDDDLFEKDGSVNFEKMTEAHPELFGEAKKADGNAGSGTDNGNQPGGEKDMNTFIRTAAGRGNTGGV